MSIFTEPTYVRKPSTSWFDLSRENKLTFPMGRLVPVFNMDCVPNDRVKINASVFLRTLAMIAPAYQRYDVSLHFFFVPYRLLWKHWEDFITGGKDGTFSATPPQLSYTSNLFNGSNVLYPNWNLPEFYDTSVTKAELQTTLENYSLFVANSCRYATESIYDYLGYPMPHYHVEDVAVQTSEGYSSLGCAIPDNIPFPMVTESFTSDNPLSSFRLSAYNLIFKEWYKDENLDMTNEELRRYVSSPLRQYREEYIPIQNKFLEWLNDVNEPFAFGYDKDGVNTDWEPVGCLFPRSWRKDYFTSALPWAQRGEVANVVTSGSFSIPVRVQGFTNAVRFAKTNGTDASDGEISTDGGYLEDNDGNSIHPTNLAAVSVLSSVFNVNDIRRMFAVQSWLERNARGGARYVEQILAHFGVRVPDARLMRSEYIGGFSQPIQISAVEQTGTYSDMDDNKQPLGNLAGRGTSANSGFICDYNVLEHGLIMGIASVMPRASYQQGVNRFLRKTDKFDFFFPEFAHLGEQEIVNEELYSNYALSNLDSSLYNTSIFGYQMRYSEYKCANDEIHGDMLQEQDHWHDGRIFSPWYQGISGNVQEFKRPALNQDFILANPSLRPFAVSPVIQNDFPFRGITRDVQDVLFGDFGFHVQARRPMPRFAEPKLVG